QLVVVSVSNYVSARVGQPSHDVEVAGGRGPVHGVRVVSTLARVHVQATPQQQVDGGQLPFLGGRVQQRPLIRFRARVQRIGVFVQQRGQPLHVAVPRRVEQLTFHRQ